MFIKKKSSELTEEDFTICFEILFNQIQLLVSQGVYSDFQKETCRAEKDFKYFFRDDYATLYLWKEKEGVLGIVGARDINECVVYVHQCQTAVPELMPILLHEVRNDFPGRIFYGVCRETDEVLKNFLRGIGSSECEIFYVGEHPFMTKEDGWMGWDFSI